MLQAHTYSDALGLNLNLCLSQIAIHVAGRVTCGQDDRTHILLLAISCRIPANGFHADHPVAINNQPRHLRLEMHLTATTENRVAHRLDDFRQTVSTDMSMGIGQDGCRGTMLT